MQHRPDGTDLGFAHTAVKMKAGCQDAEARGDASWRLVLAEEVAEAWAETDPAKLRAELVQVAAVAIAWIEDIDHRAALGPAAGNGGS